MLEPVSLTERAAEEVRHIMQNKNIPEGYGLRIGMKGGGGCGAGMNYLLGFDKPQDDDLSYEQFEIPIYVDKKHTMYLIGLQVDFYEGADARGFTFVNPEQPEQK